MPGMMMRTFRSGFAGFTLRMVMAMPLSLQYGSLGDTGYGLIALGSAQTFKILYIFSHRDGILIDI